MKAYVQVEAPQWQQMSLQRSIFKCKQISGAKQVKQWRAKVLQDQVQCDSRQRIAIYPLIPMIQDKPRIDLSSFEAIQ
jgi:hypothetical protein